MTQRYMGNDNARRYLAWALPIIAYLKTHETVVLEKRGWGEQVHNLTSFRRLLMQELNKRMRMVENTRRLLEPVYGPQTWLEWSEIVKRDMTRDWAAPFSRGYEGGSYLVIRRKGEDIRVASMRPWRKWCDEYAVDCRRDQQILRDYYTKGTPITYLHTQECIKRYGHLLEPYDMEF